jgi:hypothetical protein
MQTATETADSGPHLAHDVSKLVVVVGVLVEAGLQVFVLNGGPLKHRDARTTRRAPADKDPDGVWLVMVEKRGGPVTKEESRWC